MIGLEVNSDKFKLIKREKGKIINAIEGNLNDFKKIGGPLFVTCSTPKAIGKVYHGKVSPKVLEEEIGVSFEVRHKVFKKNDETFTFIGGVERETYKNVLGLLKNYGLGSLSRLDFSPFVFHDLLYYFNFPDKVKDFIALCYTDTCLYYAICKSSLVELVSSMERGNDFEMVSDLIKTFFEEGLSNIVITGNFPKDIKTDLAPLIEDGEIEIINPFFEFKIGVSKDFNQPAYALALGVTL